MWCVERRVTDKLSFKLQWHREAGWGEGGQGKEGRGSLQNSRGYLIVSNGQKGGRAWKIPEQSGWYGGGRGREDQLLCTKLLWRKSW